MGSGIAVVGRNTVLTAVLENKSKVDAILYLAPLIILFANSSRIPSFEYLIACARTAKIRHS